MRPPQSPRSLAVNVAILVGLLIVVAAYSPAQSDPRAPDRVEMNHAATSALGITELRVFNGEPTRVDLVAGLHGPVATVFIHRAGRGLYGDYRSVRNDDADAFYANQPAGFKRSLLNVVMTDRDILEPVAPHAPPKTDRRQLLSNTVVEQGN